MEFSHALTDVSTDARTRILEYNIERFMKYSREIICETETDTRDGLSGHYL